MADRDLSLVSRNENTIDQRPSSAPVQFSLLEIKEHFDETLASITSEYQIAEELIAAGKTEECKTIWRSQVVFLEGLLDYFIHEISKYALYQMFCGEWERSVKFESIMVPMSQVEVAVASSESKVWFFEYLNSSLSRRVFLGAKEMNDQLNQIGVGFNAVMHRAFQKSDEQYSRQYGWRIVEDLYKRRNEIAHQNDRDHATAVQNDITREFVEQSADNIKRIVNAIFDLAKENDDT